MLSRIIQLLFKVQKAHKGISGIVISPRGVELSMISTIDVKTRFEMIAGILKTDSLILHRPHVGRYICILSAVNNKIIYVLQLSPATSRFILSIHGSDRDDRVDIEVIIKLDTGIIWVEIQWVQHNRMGYSFSSSGMSYQGYFRSVDFIKKRMIGTGIPIVPNLEMLQK